MITQKLNFYKQAFFSMLKMALSQKRSKRKASGGRYKSVKGKKKHELGRTPMHTKPGARKVRTFRTIGGNTKIRLQSTDTVNLYDPKTKTYSKAKIKTIVENPANRHFVRRNIITKGAVIETDKGKAKVTNRPGQEGSVNAVSL